MNFLKNIDQLGVKVESRLPSKKNEVYLVSRGQHRYVLKKYKPEFQERAKKECKVLREAAAKGLKVPEVITFWQKKVLLLEYIPSDNLCDLLNNHLDLKYADELARWYAGFHEAFSFSGDKSLVKGDSILKNFIQTREEAGFSSGVLYGIDFEESYQGDPAQDVGQICASILDTNPMFTPEKINFCLRLIKTYRTLTGYKYYDRILESLAAALGRSAYWRPDQRVYLLEQAHLIKKKGLDGLY